MGTNFYLIDEGAPCHHCHVPARVAGEHVGKRSAAGPYCWDCDVTLCVGGKDAIHTGRNNWLDHCPQCKEQYLPQQLASDGHPAGVELGFAKPRQERPAGVCGTCSFSWAKAPEDIRTICEMRRHDATIVDEYGVTYTGAEFLGMLRAQCAMEFTHSVGMDFS